MSAFDDVRGEVTLDVMTGRMTVMEGARVLAVLADAELNGIGIEEAMAVSARPDVATDVARMFPERRHDTPTSRPDPLAEAIAAMRAYGIDDIALDQWEQSAAHDAETGTSWSAHPAAVLKVMAVVRAAVESKA